jgi:hypothetical protein
MEKKASPVSRSVYQKLKEENKRLLADLKQICYYPATFESIEVRKKWKEHFEDEANRNNFIKRMLKLGNKVTK